MSFGVRLQCIFGENEGSVNVGDLFPALQARGRAQEERPPLECARPAVENQREELNRKRVLCNSIASRRIPREPFGSVPEFRTGFVDALPLGYLGSKRGGARSPSSSVPGNPIRGISASAT